METTNTIVWAVLDQHTPGLSNWIRTRYSLSSQLTEEQERILFLIHPLTKEVFEKLKATDDVPFESLPALSVKLRKPTTPKRERRIAGLMSGRLKK